MKFSRVLSLGKRGLFGFETNIETDVQTGLFNFQIIGLADKTVGESKSRILSAIKNSGFMSPKTANQRVTVLLAPADVKKEGSHYDLPIAIAYLQATGYIKNNLKNVVFLGELSLDGSIKPIRHSIFLAHTAKTLGHKYIVVPKINTREVALVNGVKCVGFNNLKTLVEFLNRKDFLDEFLAGSNELDVENMNKWLNRNSAVNRINLEKKYLIDSIIGQEQAKRALEISLAGKHHLIMVGPPGVGKSMLAKSSVELLPDLDNEQTIVKHIVYSHTEREGAGNIEGNIRNIKKETTDIIDEKSFRPPFRSPHHSTSYSAMLGNQNMPGEISLANNGILFLDEIAEFDRRTLESLRQSLESDSINIRTASENIILPADFIMIGAMNPCKCGALNKKCTCTAYTVKQYRNKLSGPILDRIDLFLQLEKPLQNNSSQLTAKFADNLSTKTYLKNTGNDIAKKIALVRFIQKDRLQKLSIATGTTNTTKTTNITATTNRQLILENIKANLGKDSVNILNSASKKFNLSMRAMDSILLVAQTISDLESFTAGLAESHAKNLVATQTNITIKPEHILEALTYRNRSGFSV